MSFRFGRTLGNRISVPIKADKDGYLGRECPMPECEEYFKVTPGTGIQGPAPCHCPYCGHVGEADTFFTKEQIEYAKSVAFRKMADAFHQELKSLEFNHPPRGAFGIGFSLKVTPGTPIPLRWYREKNLETEIVCDQCTLRYAIYGVFAWCPDCGIHNSLQILGKNLDLARKKLALAEAVDTELVEPLVADALAGVVSAFDGFGRELCSEAESKVSFQNLEGGRKRVQQWFSFDMADCVTEEEWASARRSFQKRHLIAHKMGVIDDEYTEKAGDPTAVVGRKVTLTSHDIAGLIAIIEKIGKRLFSGVMAFKQVQSSPCSTPEN
ncbi:MAG: hypothetical protein LC114_05840 [Bryobacterales bacterium]|nr:hypothetical protein [Bryobacterales bacterium]